MFSPNATYSKYHIINPLNERFKKSAGMHFSIKENIGNLWFLRKAFKIVTEAANEAKKYHEQHSQMMIQIAADYAARNHLIDIYAQINSQTDSLTTLESEIYTNLQTEMFLVQIDKIAARENLSDEELDLVLQLVFSNEWFLYAQRFAVLVVLSIFLPL